MAANVDTEYIKDFLFTCIIDCKIHKTSLNLKGHQIKKAGHSVRFNAPMFA